MTTSSLWRYDFPASDAAIDISMEYLEEVSDEHHRYIEPEEADVEHEEFCEDLLKNQDVRAIENYRFNGSELDLVETSSGIYVIGDEERIEETQKILRSRDPRMTKNNLKRKKKVMNMFSLG